MGRGLERHNKELVGERIAPPHLGCAPGSGHWTTGPRWPNVRVISRPVLPVFSLSAAQHSMSSLSCGFCAHRNPEGSKFCNECGSPLNLVPCPQCEAINNVLERQCCRCGATLSGVLTEEVSAPVETTPEGLHGTQSAFMQGGSVPIALGDRPDAWPADLRARPDDAQTAVSNDPAHALAVEHPADPAPHMDVARSSSSDRGASYDARRPNRGYRIFVGVALLAVAGGVIFRMSASPGDGHTSPGAATSATIPAAPTQPATTTAAPPPLAPVAPPPTAGTVTESPAATTSPNNADGTSSTAASSGASSASPAPPEPPSPGAQVAQPSPLTAPDNVEANTPAPSQTTQPVVTPRSSARATNGARARTSATTRTKEQAERDAAATRRIIARQLGETPRNDAEAQRAPAR